ncbi:MAG: hypothetical protein IKR64_00220 [Treponema sp.]|nr:hypothetical protein [Treponema sp.]
MKKLFIGLMALALAFTAAVSLTGCGPTAGLQEISWDDLKDAKLYDSYGAVTKTVTYASDGTSTSTTSDEATLSGAAVKLAVAGTKASFDVIKALNPNSTGKVCANYDYSKIVTYIYTKDSDGKLVSEGITTYKKK